MDLKEIHLTAGQWRLINLLQAKSPLRVKVLEEEWA